jgi:hypothetical protein
MTIQISKLLPQKNADLSGTAQSDKQERGERREERGESKKYL